MKKKILVSMLVAVMSIIGLCTITACAETYEYLTYEITEDKELTITGCSNSVTEVVIPSCINGYPVTKIGSEAFFGRSKVTDITIPESIKVIESDAFYGCAFSNVHVDNIRAYMSVKFNGFGSIPTYMTPNLYIKDKLVTELEIPEGSEEIPSYIFYGNQSIENVIIPDSVAVIGDQAFMECANLKSATIGHGVSEVKYMIFDSCPKLTAITYRGSRNDWKKISFAMYNDGWINNATITYLLRVVILDEDGNLISSRYYNENDSIIHDEVPDKEYYHTTYYTDEERTQIYPISRAVTEWLTLYVGYRPETFITTFYWNDGSRSIYANYGDTIVPPITPKDYSDLENTYKFSHWEGYYEGITQKGENMQFWAVYTATPKEPYTKTDISSDGKVFTVVGYNIGMGKTIVLALYNRSEFVEFQKATYYADTIRFTTDKTYTKATVMVLDGISHLKPLCKPELVK